MRKAVYSSAAVLAALLAALGWAGRGGPGEEGPPQHGGRLPELDGDPGHRPALLRRQGQEDLGWLARHQVLRARRAACRLASISMRSPPARSTSAYTGPRLLHRQGQRIRALLHRCPFGPEMGEYLGWMRYGGGEQLMQELSRKYNVEAMLCGTIAPEASGWFRKEIKSRRRPQGPEDALLRPRRQRHAEARRADADPAGGRNLPGAAARHHRRHRVLHAGDGPHARASTRSPSTTTSRAGTRWRPSCTCWSPSRNGPSSPTRTRRSSRRPARTRC